MAQCSGRPCADEKGSRRSGSKVLQQPAADAAPAVCGPDISVADQRDVLDVLQTHHGKQPSILLQAPEPDPMLDLIRQLLGRHVGVLVAVMGDDPFVGVRRVVDHLEDRVKIVIGAWPDDVRHRCTDSQHARSRHQGYRKPRSRRHRPGGVEQVTAGAHREAALFAGPGLDEIPIAQARRVHISRRDRGVRRHRSSSDAPAVPVSGRAARLAVATRGERATATSGADRPRD